MSSQCMLPPHVRCTAHEGHEVKLRTLFVVQVRATFGTGNRIVAGCMVNEGLLRKGCVLVVKRGKRVALPVKHCTAAPSHT